MPIKTQELCEKCKYSFQPWCFKNDCPTCPQHSLSLHCKCLTIAKGENCPDYTPKEPPAGCEYCKNHGTKPSELKTGEPIIISTAKYTFVGDGQEYDVPLRHCPACGRKLEG